jgi:RNA polymerase sigma factor (sigma-70 family)
LSRTPAVAAASVAFDEYAKHAAEHPAIAADAGALASVAARPIEKAGEVRSTSRRARKHAVSEVASPPGRSADPEAVPMRVSTLTDQELLEGLRTGSERHFAELYGRYFQRIYNFVYARIRNHVECEEIVQETFIAVFRSFENYRGQSSLLSWIYGIAKNTTNNALRRARTQNDRIDLVEESELLPNGAVGVHSPDALLDLHRFGDELAERLQQVADWQAEIFVMRHFENLSIPEISKRTQRSSDAVRSSLYRVKRIFFETALPGGAQGIAAEDPA